MEYNYSYNVLINRFNAFADGHYLIKRFTHGQIDLADLDNDEQYPFMHVTPDVIKPSNGAITFSFHVMFADIPRDKEVKADYQREVISDCVRLAQDLIGEIKNGLVLFGYDVQMSNEPTLEPFMEEYKNTLTGIAFTIDLEVPYNWSACDIPANWSIGGASSTGGSGTPLGITFRVNGVDNAVQNVLDLVAGSGITIVDNGDGSVTFTSTGGGGGSASWGAITGTLSNQTDLQNALNAKANTADLGATAFSNDYNDLDNLPTIPTATSELTNDSGFITIGDVPTQVNADWNSVSGVSEILNKPTIPTELHDLSDVNITGPVQNDTLLFNAAMNEFQNGQLGAVAYSNDYNDLTNLPTLPPTVGDMLKSVYDTDNDGIVDFAESMKTEVRNSTGATLYKGHIVYLSGSTGNLPNAVYAQANNDANSAQTFGVVYADIANNSDGFVITLGQINTLDTRPTATNPFTSDTLVDGDVVYLSPTTPGHITNIKPSAPQHIVYVGMVVRTSPTNGTIQYRIQNGYELDELHNVVATAPANNDYLYYDASTSLYRLRQLTAARITDTTTVGQNLVKLTNPSAISYLRINADNSVSALTASQLKTELGGKQFVFKTADQSSNALGFADVTDLSFAVVAGRTYKFKILCQFDVTNPATGSRWAVNGPSFTRLFYNVIVSSTNATGTQANVAYQVYDGPAVTTGSNFATNNCAIIEGIVVPSANGTLSARFACELTITSVTCKAGSYIEFEEI